VYDVDTALCKSLDCLVDMMGQGCVDVVCVCVDCVVSHSAIHMYCSCVAK